MGPTTPIQRARACSRPTKEVAGTKKAIMRPLRLDGPTKLSDSLMRLNVSGSVFVVPRETLTRHDPG